MFSSRRQHYQRCRDPCFCIRDKCFNQEVGGWWRCGSPSPSVLSAILHIFTSLGAGRWCNYKADAVTQRKHPVRGNSLYKLLHESTLYGSVRLKVEKSSLPRLCTEARCSCAWKEEETTIIVVSLRFRIKHFKKMTLCYGLRAKICGHKSDSRCFKGFNHSAVHASGFSAFRKRLKISNVVSHHLLWNSNLITLFFFSVWLNVSNQTV